MKRGIWAYGLILLLLLAGVGSLLIGCDDGAGTALPSNDYTVYLWDDSSSPLLYRYHPLSHHIDSIHLPWKAVQGISVAGDGRMLYVALDTGVLVVEADSFSPVTCLPYRPRGPVAVSPDNQLVAILGDSLVVVRSSDYAVVFREATPVWSGAFADDSRILACAGDPSSSEILVVDLGSAEGVVERITLEEGSPQAAIPVMGGERILVYVKNEDLLYRLAVIDRLSSKEVYTEYIYPGSGYMAGAAGWDRAVYTNSGRPNNPEGSSSFKIFDIDANEPVAEVNTRRFIDDSVPEAFPVGPVVVTPDHRWLVALNAPVANELLLYDLKNGEFTDWRQLGQGRTFQGLSVQAQR